MSLIDETKQLLDKVESDPEALLFLISGAIDRLNALDCDYKDAFSECWQTMAHSSTWN